MAIADDYKSWHAFSGGEITEELFGRADLAEYQMALKMCKNFVVLPHGPLKSRAGTQFVGSTKDNGRARLIPFIRGNGEALILEFGEGYIRFHRDGGTILDGAAEQVVASIGLVPASDPPIHTFCVIGHTFNDGDPVILYGVTRDGQPVATGGVYTVADSIPDFFHLLDSSGQYLFSDDTDPILNDTYAGGYVNDANAAIYEVVTGYEVEELFQLRYEQSEDTISIAHNNWIPREIHRNADNDWESSALVPHSLIDPPASAPTVVARGVGAGNTPSPDGNPLVYRYVVTAVHVGGEESIASDANGVENDLAVNGQWNTITWVAVADAAYYNVYKEWAESGRFYLISSTTDNVVGVVDDNIIPDFTKAPPELTDPFDSTLVVDPFESNDHTTTIPACVSYFEQRRVFAATLGDPQRFWFTKSGSDHNMNVSIAPQDDDPFNYRLRGARAHTIRHIIPFANLLMLTGSALWRISPDSGGQLTPLNAFSKIQAPIGATNARPTTFREFLMYANARGEHLISFKFSEEAGGYEPEDLSLVAAHLIDGMGWVQMDFQEAPYPTWWGVRSDGKLIGLTYSPKQNIIAWHQHEIGGTDAFVESVAVIPENDGKSDLVYIIVRRTINEEVVRYIEFITPRDFADLEHSFCVDSGLMYDGDPIDTVTGLDHLEGETISVLADGIPLTAVVTGGEIVLEDEASVIIAGYGYNCDVITPPLVYQARAQGMEQQEIISGVKLRVKDADGLSVGPSFDSLKEFTRELGDTTNDLRSGIVQTPVDFGWSEDSEVHIRQGYPLPATITAMSIDFGGAN